jgi:hypothetical protein
MAAISPQGSSPAQQGESSVAIHLRQGDGETLSSQTRHHLEPLTTTGLTAKEAYETLDSSRNEIQAQKSGLGPVKNATTVASSTRNNTIATMVSSDQGPGARVNEAQLGGAIDNNALESPDSIQVEADILSQSSTQVVSTTPTTTPSTEHNMKPSESQSPSNSNHDIGTQWGIGWFLPSCMVILGLAGASGALGHHFYYRGLNEHMVKDSDWIQRYGIALAFFTKICLVSSAGIAYKQRIWVSFPRLSFLVV